MTHKCQLWSVDNIVHFFHQGKGELFLLALKKTNFPILSAKLHLLIEFSFIQNGCKVRNNIDTQQLQKYNKLIFNNNCSDKGKIKIPD